MDDDEEGKDQEDEVGIMSDSGESDVDDDIGDPDWEAVKHKDGDDDEFSFKPGMPNLPEKGITISFGRPRRGKRVKGKKGSDGEDEYELEEEVVSKKKRRGMDLNEVVRRSINRVKITEQLMKHKLSLLLYIARGLRLVKIANCNVIRGLALSVVDERFKIKGKKSDRKLLEIFMEQFNKVIQVTGEEDVRLKHMQQPFMLNLLECFSTLETTSLIELVVIFVACLKALRPSLPIRIVNVLRPLSLRADIIPKPSTVKEEDENGNKTADSGAKKPATKQPVVVEIEDVNEIIEKLDYWVEVYLADEKKWCCVDLCNVKLDEPNVLTELARPFCYLVSYDLDRYCVKQAEKNYCEDWYTPAFRRGRCEDKWYDSVMAALGPSKIGEKDHADETKREEILIKQDMPTSDNGFRNHPLYVLEKHLLKFQAIYPPEVAPMGFFKEVPIFPRDCVQTVRSRETWLREARTVKPGEYVYKTVTARPKRDKFTGNLIKDIPLELFGEWQTQEYDPPVAENGKVPRNAYGNVDMYQPCMLPKGCAWLKLAGLPRVANKLGIDCAAAVVGFDNHCGSYGAHPVIEGFIVCEEFAETLQMAWEEEQENSRKRSEEKRQKRIWDNWRRLIKASMVREKLRVKYKNS
ncbi:uncharacterized protein LOC143869100 [Tasmannia lanceolata]|uniref:uncharacterized protein LOC143869100 n=1 Tax=Tasmannia lanceolata TaxID=3420 RepID=UPI004063EB13